MAVGAEPERAAPSHYGETSWSVAVQALAVAGAAYSYATLPDKLFAVRSNTFTQMHWIGPVFWTVLFAAILAILPPSRFSPLIDKITLRRDWRRAGGVIMWAFAVEQLWGIGLLF